MARRTDAPDFVEAIARGFDVIRAFGPQRPVLTLSEVAAESGLARPTARRILLTLEALGYARGGPAGFSLTPRVLELGMAYVGGLGLWEVARQHMRDLVAITGESSSISQLDGSDIVYVARVAVPKIIALRVEVGTRFPAVVCSQGKVLLAALDPADVPDVLAISSRSGIVPHRAYRPAEVEPMLREVRARGWALADDELAPGIRSVAVPVRDGSGAVRAAMNVTVHSAETSVRTLLDQHLPPLREAASAISADWAAWQARPQEEAADRPARTLVR